jgi:hypothetical protein
MVKQNFMQVQYHTDPRGVWFQTESQRNKQQQQQTLVEKQHKGLWQQNSLDSPIN